MSVKEPLRVRVTEEKQAQALVRELADFEGVEVQQDTDSWEVTVGDGTGDRLVIAVLDAVRRALNGQPSASALVLLDGREYQLRGE